MEGGGPPCNRKLAACVSWGIHGLRFFSGTACPSVARVGQPPQKSMFNALKSLNPIAVLVVSIVAFLIGGLWYSPLLFVKAWMAQVNMTPERAKAAGGGKARMAGAFLLTVVSTCALAVLVAVRHASSPVNGAEIGLFVGTVLVGARAATNNIFELRSMKYFLIVTGHDVVQFTIVGAILGVWR